jgi:hypothetical protein
VHKILASVNPPPLIFPFGSGLNPPAGNEVEKESYPWYEGRSHRSERLLKKEEEN